MAQLEVKLKTIAVGKLCVCIAPDGSGNAVIYKITEKDDDQVTVARLGGSVEKKMDADTLVQPVNPAQGIYLCAQLANLEQLEEKARQDALLRSR
ncbi:MAG: hypothetical protein NTZ65_03730 [Candidatus Berkelbacteria bacterium]|nr:hypothetical protein [Candidatus Berkelbacteria bacterium]